MDEKELNKIKNNYKEIEESVLNYLPQLENLLVTNMKTEKEKADMHSLAKYCIYKNSILLSLIKIIINTYEKFPNTIPTIINNLRQNSDFNKTKYKLDFENIDKERFTSYLKNHVIICGNYFINTLYKKLLNHKKEMEEMILKISKIIS